jgi:hypothetical protein
VQASPPTEGLAPPSRIGNAEEPRTGPQPRAGRPPPRLAAPEKLFPKYFSVRGGFSRRQLQFGMSVGTPHRRFMLSGRDYSLPVQLPFAVRNPNRFSVCEKLFPLWSRKNRSQKNSSLRRDDAGFTLIVTCSSRTARTGGRGASMSARTGSLSSLPTPRPGSNTVSISRERARRSCACRQARRGGHRFKAPQTPVPIGAEPGMVQDQEPGGPWRDAIQGGTAVTGEADCLAAAALIRRAGRPKRATST